MKFTRFIFLVALVMFVGTLTATAATIRVSSKSGNSLQKLKNAYNSASWGDIVLVDIDVYFGNNDGPFTISKGGITLKGDWINSTSKYKIQRPDRNKVMVKVTGTNCKVENLLFIGASQQLLFSNNSTTINNTTVYNCEFKDCGYTGIDFRGKFNNTRILKTKFDDCKFSLQTFDCPVLSGFLVEDCVFDKGDHQLSLDNPNATISNHSNIKINRCVFKTCSRFNIALANTRNVRVTNCDIQGGSGAYSQALHIEDRSWNIYAGNNTIKCIQDVAVIIYSTDKFGHGTGARLTYNQKVNYGAGNVTLDNNYIQSGNNDAAISVGFGRGYLRVWGNNTIVSNNRGISSFESKNRMSFEINDKAKIKGKTYSQIKAITNLVVRKTYVNLN